MKTILKKIGMLTLFVCIFVSGFVMITNSPTKNTKDFLISHNWQHSIFK